MKMNSEFYLSLRKGRQPSTAVILCFPLYNKFTFSVNEIIRLLLSSTEWRMENGNGATAKFIAITFAVIKY
jgi:hypothetical protein